MSEPTEASVRAEVRAWLEANWNPELGLVEWRNKLCESGWGAPHWPKQWYGRDLPVAFTAVGFHESHRDGETWLRKMPGLATLVEGTHWCEIDIRTMVLPHVGRRATLTG